MVLIGIDPGLSDILYCVNGADPNENQLQYRYTQNSRRKVLNIKRNLEQLQKKKESHLLHDNRSVQTWEAEGTATNARTFHVDRYQTYLRFKNRLNFYLRPFYSQNSFRRQRFAQFSNKQKADMKLLVEFRRFHGQAQAGNVVVAIGNWEQRIHRHHEPIKGKGMRRVLEKAGYNVFLIDEYRTSKQCSKCSVTNAQVEKFRYVQNPRPWMNGVILCHG
jgi:hypothetical protein